MNKDALRIKVAELCVSQFACCRCAYSDDDIDGTAHPATLIRYGAAFCSEECAERVSDNTLDDGQQVIPDYPSDLNAMHEAEKMLTDFQMKKYGYELQEIVNYYCVGVVEDYPRHLMCLAKIARATAEQRCLAFIRTMENVHNS